MLLGADFFNRPVLKVAKDLLGKHLVREVEGSSSTPLGTGEMAFLITETEAYDGPADLACHARSGLTARNAPMWGPPGHAYVYFTYGMHFMLNLVCREEGYPAAVLIRGLATDTTSLHTQVCKGVGSMPKLDGPAKLTKFLRIDKTLSGKPLSRESGLWVEDRGLVVPPRSIRKKPRIGIAYAEEYAMKPWRFVWEPKKKKSGS